jgi:class 3 adenylate cyclase/tetratricopeptide (TPR) repeat protein
MSQRNGAHDRRVAAMGPVCPCCLKATVAGAICCQSCGTLLPAIVQAAGDAASAIPSDPRHRRPITFVYFDLVQSERLSRELDPEDFTALLATFHRTAAEAIKEFGGFVARHDGDCTFAYFGYPDAQEDDAERAIGATLRAFSNLAAIGDARLRAHAGIASGPVIVGDTMGVAGNAPYRAAHLQGAAPPDATFVDESTRRLVGDLVEWIRPADEFLVTLPEKERVWQALGMRLTDNRFAALRGDSLAPILGRAGELSALEQSWHAALGGSGSVVVVSGEAGVGKSRLAAQFLDQPRPDGPLARIRCTCRLHRQVSPFHPVIQQLELAAGFAPGDDAPTRLAKLARALPPLPERDLQLIAELVQIPTTGLFPPLQHSPQRRYELMLDALVGVVVAAAQRRPTVLLFDDVHWIDSSSLDFLNRLGRRCAGAPLMLLVLTRPGMPLPELAALQARQLDLPALGNDDCSLLARWAAGERTLPEGVLADIVKRSDGLPLYVEELTRALLEEGDAPRVHSVPDPLQSTLQARLDRLGKDCEIVEVAACIGREFSDTLLARVLGTSTDELRPALDRLVAARLVLAKDAADADGQVYEFRHVLLQELAYFKARKDVRRPRHRAIVLALETHFPARSAAQPEIMLHHCEKAEMADKLVQYALQAGRQAMRRSAMASPGRQYALDLNIALGQAMLATQGYAVASTRETFQRARDLCQGPDAPPQLLSVLHGLWTHALMVADMEQARSQAAALLELGRKRDEHLWLLMGYRFFGVTHHPLGEFMTAVEFLRAGISIYDPAQRAVYASVSFDDPEVVMLTYLSWSLMCVGRLDESRRTSALALEKAQSLNHVYTLAHALIGTSFVALTIESPRAGLALLDKALPLLEEHGIAYYFAVGLLFKGYCHAALGEAATAREFFERGLRNYRATGSRLYLAGFLRMAAESMWRIGDLAAAEAHLAESASLLHETGQRWDEAELHRIQGRLLLARGDIARARAEAATAHDIAVRQGAGLWRLRAASDLAELAADAAPAPDGMTAFGRLAAACRAVEGAPDLPDLARARELMANLV